MEGPNDLGKAIRRLRGERPQAKLAVTAQPDLPAAHPAPLVRETDRMLRKIDRQLDNLLSSKSALLRMREQLVSGSSQ